MVFDKIDLLNDIAVRIAVALKPTIMIVNTDNSEKVTAASVIPATARGASMIVNARLLDALLVPAALLFDKLNTFEADTAAATFLILRATPATERVDNVERDGIDT